MLGLKIAKFRILLQERQLPVTRRAIAMFPNQNISNISLFLCIRIINLLTINEHHHVRILFNGPRFPKIREDGPFIRPVFHGPAQLGKRHHRDIQFLG